MLEGHRTELSETGLGDEAQVITSGSIRPCERDPNMVVHPEGMWCSGVQVSDTPGSSASTS